MRAVEQIGPVAHHLAPHDLVNPGRVHIQPAQFLGQRVSIAASGKIGRRALQHGHVRAAVGQRRDQGCRGRTRTNHSYVLTRQIETLWPVLGVDDLALEPVHARPLGRVAFLMPVVCPPRGGDQRLCRPCRGDLPRGTSRGASA